MKINPKTSSKQSIIKFKTQNMELVKKKKEDGKSRSTRNGSRDEQNHQIAEAIPSSIHGW